MTYVTALFLKAAVEASAGFVVDGGAEVPESPKRPLRYYENGRWCLR